jgi:NitT/TauT family transport system substrate-binding protein
VQRSKLAVGDDAVELRDPAVYTEKFNLCTKEAHLDDPATRARIVAFVRALIEAAQRLKRDPRVAQTLVAQAAHLDIEIVRSAWPYFTYPGTLAPDLLEVFEAQEPWIAKTQRRTPRSRDALARLIDDSVLREALVTAP